MFNIQRALLQMVVDGYNAPLPVGNFLDTLLLNAISTYVIWEKTYIQIQRGMFYNFSTSFVPALPSKTQSLMQYYKECAKL